jgi:hypothetical protein
MIYVLIGLAIIGYLPLVVILWRRNKTNRILNTGTHAMATVQQIFYSRRSHVDIVYYYFTDSMTGRQYSGSFSIKQGVYKPGDPIDIYFDPKNPKRNTVKGAWASSFLIWFGVAIGLFVTFAAFKLWEMT